MREAPERGRRHHNDYDVGCRSKPASLLEAYIAAIVAFLIFAVPASMQQHRHSPIVNHATPSLCIDWTRVFIVAAMLIVALSGEHRHQPAFS